MRLSGSELECIRGGKRVFANIGFAVGAGEALLLLGPNGAGKSSLLRMVAGLRRPAAGSLELAGADCDRSLSEQAQYLGHLDPLKSSLSAGGGLILAEPHAPLGLDSARELRLGAVLP